MGRDGDASMPAKFAADCARKVWKGVAEKWMASGWASEVYCSLFIWITELSLFPVTIVEQLVQSRTICDTPASR
jgi:hypothetical protein